jgi:hypothetical protein
MLCTEASARHDKKQSEAAQREREREREREKERERERERERKTERQRERERRKRERERERKRERVFTTALPRPWELIRRCTSTSISFRTDRSRDWRRSMQYGGNK